MSKNPWKKRENKEHGPLVWLQCVCVTMSLETIASCLFKADISRNGVISEFRL